MDTAALHCIPTFGEVIFLKLDMSRKVDMPRKVDAQRKGGGTTKRRQWNPLRGF